MGKGWVWIEMAGERRLDMKPGRFKGSKREERMKGRHPRDAIVLRPHQEVWMPG